MDDALPRIKIKASIMNDVEKAKKGQSIITI